MIVRPRLRLAIIGAGPAGLAAAYKLRDAGHVDVTVFEKSHGGCGRAASRSRHGIKLDPGANYFRTDFPDVAELIHEQLPDDQLVEIIGHIDVFDRNETIDSGDAISNAERKWTYRNGINTLGKLLAEAAGCDIRYGARVGRVFRHSDSRLWHVQDDECNDYGTFDAILLALPAPQAHDLLIATHADIASAFMPASYQSQWSFTFGFDAGKHDWPGKSYALINRDRQHHIAWLSRENAKPHRVPDHTLVIMAQMQPQWSLRNIERTEDVLAEEVSSMIAGLFNWRSARFRWFDAKRWKFSLPTGRADVEKLEAFETDRIFVAGDSILGKGRVTLALQSGLDVAARIYDSD